MTSKAMTAETAEVEEAAGRGVLLLSSAEAEERHYTPEEAAALRLVPIGARMIRKLAYARQIAHTNNNKIITLQLRHCRAISAMYEVAPFTEPVVSRKPTV
ncbi:hypothetical protein ACZ91_57260 [Streptomyces regensis]|nr:hypothetical protein ACZ91_57260 [Streptomyces regensis]